MIVTRYIRVVYVKYSIHLSKYTQTPTQSRHANSTHTFSWCERRGWRESLCQSLCHLNSVCNVNWHSQCVVHTLDIFIQTKKSGLNFPSVCLWLVNTIHTYAVCEFVVVVFFLFCFSLRDFIFFLSTSSKWLRKHIFRFVSMVTGKLNRKKNLNGCRLKKQQQENVVFFCLQRH